MIYYDLDCEQINVIIAFLNILFKKTIYVKQFKNYKKKEKRNCILIYFLLKVLYSFKQTLRE